MSVAIAIMAHRDREFQARRLAEMVSADHVSWDDGSLGENTNGDTAWRMLLNEKADWGIVLQDDAVPVENFREVVSEMLDHARQDTAVGLYVGTSRPQAREVQYAVDLARATEASWLEHDDMLWGVGVALPMSLVADMLKQIATATHPYDRRIGRYFQWLRRPVRYTWPSLVDHADGESILDRVTLRVPRTLPRVAHQVGTPASWDGPVVTIPHVGARLRSSRT